MEEILKGNYKAPGVKIEEKTPEKGTDTLGEEFEAAALKKLGGSITFVKKKGSGFTWRGKK